MAFAHKKLALFTKTYIFSNMIYDEFKRHVGKAGLTIRAFADLLKLKPASISNYSKTGKVPSHLAVIIVLLAEMAEHRIDYREVLSRADIAPKKARGAGKGKFAGDPQDLLFDISPTRKTSGETK
jgi:hypothetical protein